MELQEIEAINKVIQNRQSIFPVSYIDKEIPKPIIEQILHNANNVPTHKHTEPWRFTVIRGNKRQELANFLADKYRSITPTESFKQKKYDGLLSKPLMANTIIIIKMVRDKAERIPEWEEIASVAMAVQNMYLTCTANDIGCYWSSPKLMEHISDYIPMEANEKCLGFFYMGYYNKKPRSKIKGAIEGKVQWLE